MTQKDFEHTITVKEVQMSFSVFLLVEGIMVVVAKKLPFLEYYMPEMSFDEKWWYWSLLSLLVSLPASRYYRKKYPFEPW